jgi:hypothetical protein
MTIFDEPRQWQGFIIAALRADYDYEQHRNMREHGKALSKKIAKSAENLSNLLVEFQSLNLDKQPPEFTSVQYLLAATEIWGFEIGRSEKWRQLRPVILGEIEFSDGLPLHQSNNPESFSVLDLFTDDFERLVRPLVKMESNFDESQSDIKLAWNMAPEPALLLKTLAASASKFTPKQVGMVGAAIRSRKRDRYIQYIRAFHHALENDYHINITPPIVKAIVIVTNVVLNDPENDISEEGVRKALR